MIRRDVLVFLTILPAAGCSPDDRDVLLRSIEGAIEGSGGPLGDREIAQGMREALRIGTGRVVAALGAADGFNTDPALHIPLPGILARAQASLRAIGASALADDLELRLNRAAEQAMPIAKTLFWEAIEGLSFADVLRIYRGPDDAATRYLESTTRMSLNARMKPIIEDALANAGAIAAYDAIVKTLQALPFLPDLRGGLTGHVLERSMDGLFSRLAVEEAAIRKDPAKRTTELLKRVFGANS